MIFGAAAPQDHPDRVRTARPLGPTVHLGVGQPETGRDGLSMNLVWASLVVAAGIAVAAMLLVRRNAPDGG
jgi:hypothetical protein